MNHPHVSLEGEILRKEISANFALFLLAVGFPNVICQVLVFRHSFVADVAGEASGPLLRPQTTVNIVYVSFQRKTAVKYEKHFILCR